MFIVLPNKIGGLPELETKLTGTMVDQIDQVIGEAKLQVAIPKFKIEADLPMKDLLAGLGMGDLFDADNADLSGISGNKDLYVSNVFHKSFVEVNEEGSEAAAATGIFKIIFFYVCVFFLKISKEMFLLYNKYLCIRSLNVPALSFHHATYLSGQFFC